MRYSIPQANRNLLYSARLAVRKSDTPSNSGRSNHRTECLPVDGDSVMRASFAGLRSDSERNASPSKPAVGQNCLGLLPDFTVHMFHESFLILQSFRQRLGHHPKFFRHMGAFA